MHVTLGAKAGGEPGHDFITGCLDDINKVILAQHGILVDYLGSPGVPLPY